MHNLKPCPYPATGRWRGTENSGDHFQQQLSNSWVVELFVVVHKADRILGPFDALSFVLLESLPSAKCVKCYVKLNLHPRSYLSGVHSLPKQKVLSSLSCFLPGGFTKS